MSKRKKSNKAIPDIFRLVVDYSQSLEEMIAAGRYDWVNSFIDTERFPVVGNGVVEFEARYFHPGWDTSSTDVVKEIGSAYTRNPWMPAKTEHLLAHGKTFPDEQLKFLIVGLGSVAEVCSLRSVPCLVRNGFNRRLDLRWWNVNRDLDYRALVVRNVSGT